MPESFYEITQNDVGKGQIRAFGNTWLVSNFMGQILDIDVGKRVYKRGNILQVENQQQFEARINLPR